MYASHRAGITACACTLQRLSYSAVCGCFYSCHRLLWSGWASVLLCCSMYSGKVHRHSLVDVHSYIASCCLTHSQSYHTPSSSLAQPSFWKRPGPPYLFLYLLSFLVFFPLVFLPSLTLVGSHRQLYNCTSKNVIPEIFIQIMMYSIFGCKGDETNSNLKASCCFFCVYG